MTFITFSPLRRFHWAANLLFINKEHDGHTEPSVYISGVFFSEFHGMSESEHGKRERFD